MNTDQINRGNAFKVEGTNGFVRSVSIIFHINSLGYLLCTESRKGYPDPNVKTNQSHLIGGKVEMSDISTVQTGLREFCEETDYRLGSSVEETMKELIEKINICSLYKWDYCVSPKKELYNRFYVINLDECENVEFLNSFISFVQNWKKTDKSPLNSLFFWQEGSKFEIEETSLLSLFAQNLPSE